MKSISLGIVIQARTGSTRLPNKILLDFFFGKTILDVLLENLKIKFLTFPIILATSVNEDDAIFEKFALKYDINLFRGDETNVLERFIGVGEKYNLTHLIRICSDNPFLQMKSIEDLIAELKSKDIDYLSYHNHLGIPVVKTHIGLFAEIVSLKALKETDLFQKESLYQEHVTNYVYGHTDKFKVILKSSPSEVFRRDDIRLTLDDSDDFENLSSLYGETYKNKEDLSFLIDFIDKNVRYKHKMLTNIKKYSK